MRSFFWLLDYIVVFVRVGWQVVEFMFAVWILDHSPVRSADGAASDSVVAVRGSLAGCSRVS